MLEHAAHLLILLVAARLFGRLALAIGQPSSVGEVFGGVAVLFLIAPFSDDIPLLQNLVGGPVMEIASEIGIFFLLLYTGIEMQPKEISDHSKQSFAVAIGGMALPLIFGFAFAWMMLPESAWKSTQALVVGTALSISAIAVAARILMEFDLLHKPIGEIIVTAAIFDDVFGLVLLALVTSMISIGHFPGLTAILFLGLKIAFFFLTTGAIGYFAYPWIWRQVAKLPIPGARLSGLLVFGLAFSLLAETLGLHFLLGAFMAGLFFETGRVGEETYARTKTVIGNVTLGFFGPIFFAYIGCNLDLSAVFAIPGFLLGLLLIAFLGKLIGGGLPAYWGGLTKRHALAVGVGLSGRGAVELVVASIALKAGVFTIANGDHPILSHLFSALVITAVATTLLTPVLLRWGLRPATDRPSKR